MKCTHKKSYIYFVIHHEIFYPELCFFGHPVAELSHMEGAWSGAIKPLHPKGETVWTSYHWPDNYLSNNYGICNWKEHVVQVRLRIHHKEIKNAVGEGYLCEPA